MYQVWVDSSSQSSSGACLCGASRQMSKLLEGFFPGASLGTGLCCCLLPSLWVPSAALAQLWCVEYWSKPDLFLARWKESGSGEVMRSGSKTPGKLLSHNSWVSILGPLWIFNNLFFIRPISHIASIYWISQQLQNLWVFPAFCNRSYLILPMVPHQGTSRHEYE